MDIAHVRYRRRERATFVVWIGLVPVCVGHWQKNQSPEGWTSMDAMLTLSLPGSNDTC
jgi:hypothetical protein